MHKAGNPHPRMTLGALLAACSLAVALAGITLADPLDDARSAYHRNDYATALRLFEPLADQGFADAQLYLGIMHAGGLGVPQDDADAVRWYRKAADQGNVTAQNFLGLMYYMGRGVPQDYVQADKWFTLSAAQPDGAKISWAVRLRDQMERVMTSVQLAEAQKLAHEWKPK